MNKKIVMKSEGVILKIKHTSSEHYQGDCIDDIKPIMMFNAKKIYKLLKQVYSGKKENRIDKLEKYGKSIIKETGCRKDDLGVLIFILITHPGECVILDLMDTVTLGFNKKTKEITVVLERG